MGSKWFQHKLSGAAVSLRSYAGHTVTGMSGANGSSQLMLHLQSPAAAAAAQQAAEAAAAAREAFPAAWQEHQVGGMAPVLTVLQLIIWQLTGMSQLELCTHNALLDSLCTYLLCSVNVHHDLHSCAMCVLHVCMHPCTASACSG
jgi:hypothetical protein